MLVAGGIGINPLYAIIRDMQQGMSGAADGGDKLCLLYSATSTEELAFRENIQAMALAHTDSFRCVFSTTRDRFARHIPKHPKLKNGFLFLL